jgi:cytochrome c oxidase subunit III
MSDAQPAIQFTDLRQQHDAAELGMWVFLGTEVLFFGALILAYCVYRIGDPQGFAAAARHTQLAIGSGNTALLLTSSFVVAWAVAAVKLNAGRFASVLLWIAAGLGVIFLGLKGFEYRLEYDEHLVPGLDFSNSEVRTHTALMFFSLYFIMTALHALHVLIGVIALVTIGWRARHNAYSERYHAPASVAGLYWHFVDVVWIFLFALIYLPGRAP